MFRFTHIQMVRDWDFQTLMGFSEWTGRGSQKGSSAPWAQCTIAQGCSVDRVAFQAPGGPTAFQRSFGLPKLNDLAQRKYHTKQEFIGVD